jgi:lysophospholipase L1-like esterase
MLYHVATLALAPVFFLQGMWVRRVTPILPEPEGARQGVWGVGPDLRLLILGDSAAAGVGVKSQAEALSGKLVAALGTFYRVHWKLLANSGHDSAEVLARLQAEPVATFDVVVVSVGVNDVTGRTSTARWQQNLQSIADLLVDRFQARMILFSSLPPMHFFPALPQPLRWWLGLRANTLRRQLRKMAIQHPYCHFVDVAFPFDRDYMAADGFHPGSVAYAMWSEQLAAVIRRG